MPTDPLPSLTLKSAEFRRERERGWRELELLLEQAQRRGVASLGPEALERLPLLYRAALSSLSVARAIALDRHLLLYLEDLALRAYLVVYGPRTRLAEAIADFFRRGLPAAVQAVRWHIILALLALLAGTAAGFLLTVGDEAWFSVLVPTSLAADRGPWSTRADLLNGEIFAPWRGFIDSFLTLANFLFQHNTAIGMLSFSLGFLAGVPTLLLTAYQGLSFGAFLALHYDRGLTLAFLGWVSIHGVTEFGAIILCAAGGLLVAEKVLFPGRFSRLESLSRCGPTAARIAMGAMLLFFLAAVLEGGFRQLVQSTPLRLAIGLGVGAAWMLYLSRRVLPVSDQDDLGQGGT
jgi:uncharacterized membrane protein SpoIIM required for sporulation